MSSLVQFRHISSHRAMRICAIAVFAALVIIMLRKTLADVFVIAAGGAVVACLTQPLAGIYEKRLSRNLAALCALLTWLVVLLSGLMLLLPMILTEIVQIIDLLPQSARLVQSWFQRISDMIQNYLPGIQIAPPSFGGEQLPRLAQETITFAEKIARFFYRFSLMTVLGYFFLCDRRRLMIRLELIIPRRKRTAAVQIASAIYRDLKGYLCGQGLISGIVGILSAIALTLAGVRSALVLGIIVGVLNMIPYFGPVIGAIPAILVALSDGWFTALNALVALWLVQQIDGTLISPQIMGNVSGLTPAAVLLAIFIGSEVAGIIGMLLAVPVVMAYRTVFRFFVRKNENV